MSVQAHAWARMVHTGSPTLKAVLRAIADYADPQGVAWPSQEQIAEDTEFSLRAVRNAIAGLEEAGFLTRQERRRRDGSRQSDTLTLTMIPNTNRHEVPLDQPAPRSEQPAPRSNQPAPHTDQPARGAGFTTFEPPENHQKDSFGPDVSAWPIDYRVRFREAYPHWVKGPVAFAELDRLHREGDTPFGDILDGIARYVASKPPDRNWMGPDRFLADRRFEDRPAPIAPRLVRPCRDEPTGHAAVLANLYRRRTEATPHEPEPDDLIHFDDEPPAPDDRVESGPTIDHQPTGSRGEDRGLAWAAGPGGRPAEPVLRAARFGAHDRREAAALRRRRPA